MTLALEINDAGLVLAADGEVLAETPGCAMLDGPEPQTGVAALRRARLKPLYADSRYWQDLGTEPLARATPAARSAAEVAYAQLVEFARPWLGQGPEVLLAVPAWYTREQLSLLLGIVREAGLEPCGLVDAALAASALEPAPEQVLHLELCLHRGVLTVLDHAAELRRVRYELLPQHGVLALQQAWLATIADRFVRRTRFDPLHEAATEQRLADALPDWLEQLRAAGTATAQLGAGGVEHSVELQRTDLLAAVERIYDDYVRAVQRARPAQGAIHLRLSQRLATLPGLEERLGEIRDCEVRRLPRGAAALGALAYERNLRRSDGGLALVQRLPVPLARATPRAGAATAVPPAERPTHLLHATQVIALAGRPLTLGADVPPEQRALRLGPGPGISRRHCTLLADADGVWLEDHSTFGTLVNGERAGGRVALRAGDRLRIGSPGVECLLVREVGDDGAA